MTDKDNTDADLATQNGFFSAKAKLTIASVDEPFVQYQVVAQYNPKELSLTQPISWAQHTGTSQSTYLQFGGVGAQTTQLELLFDGYEAKKSVQDRIDALKDLALVRKPGSADEDYSRPHMCQVTWGVNGMPPLYCVIESIVTKYLMFGNDGTALRATCTVSVKECRRVGKALVADDGKVFHVAR